MNGSILIKEPSTPAERANVNPVPKAGLDCEWSYSWKGK